MGNRRYIPWPEWLILGIIMVEFGLLILPS
jgi:hypothetical protein